MAAVAMQSDAELRAEYERVLAENVALKAAQKKGVSIKVSEKGGVSVYGCGRFPITLYREQWETVLNMGQDIRDFIKAHDHELKSKNDGRS